MFYIFSNKFKLMRAEDASRRIKGQSTFLAAGLRAQELKGLLIKLIN